MKNAVLYMAAAVMLIFVACKKDKNAHPEDNAPQPKNIANLQGEWKAVSFLTGNGGPVRWEPVTEQNHIAFSFNGLFTSTNMIFDTYDLEMVSGTWSGDTVLTLSKAAQPQGQNGFFIINRLTKDTLVLSNGYCLDFCGTKYTRVK